MADYPKTKFITTDAITRKRWARDLFKIILPAVEFNELVGSGSDSIVQMRSELGKGEGDVVKFDIRLPLEQAGIVGYDTVEGNEEKLIFRQFEMTIEELNLAVDTGGRMEEQRAPYNLLTEGKDALKDRWGAILSDAVINTLCGNTTFAINGKTFAQACTAPDVGHHLAVNQSDGTAVATAEAAITSADVLDLTFLDRMKQRAEVPYTNCYKMRPAKVLGGKNYYLVIMHNYVFDALRQNTNVGQWGDLLRSANKLGVPQVEIEYNGLLIRKSERVPKMSAVGSGGVYRTVLCGAQAATWAWGGAGESRSTELSFIPYTRDAGRYMMVRGGGIWGVKKVFFNTKGADRDYGVITGSSYGQALT